jgi:hypothetical protein
MKDANLPEHQRFLIVGPEQDLEPTIRQILSEHPDVVLVDDRSQEEVPILDEYPDVPLIGELRRIPSSNPAPVRVSRAVVCMYCSQGGGTLVRVGKKGRDAKYKHEECGG